MIFGRLFKKGTVQRTHANSLVLVNEDNVSYSVDNADMAIWNECNGITFDQLCSVIGGKIGWQVPANVLSHIERYVNWCIWAKLIEVREFTPDQFKLLLLQQQGADVRDFKEQLLVTVDGAAADIKEE